MQSALLVIAPCFLTAFIYVDFSTVLRLYGPSYGHLSPKFARWVYVVADAICILIQASVSSIERPQLPYSLPFANENLLTLFRAVVSPHQPLETTRRTASI